MCFTYMIVVSICFVLGKGLPVPENVQASLKFVNKLPLITVTWDPPLINSTTEINSYEVAIFKVNNSQQLQDMYVVDNQTTSLNISNVAMSANYYVSMRVNYTAGYGEAINTSSIGIRYLQNFIADIEGNLLRAKCFLAKSNLFMDCQLVVTNAKKNHQILSPVNIMQSNFSMLLPASKDEFLVTARAVDVHGDTVDSEAFNVNFEIAAMITPSVTPSAKPPIISSTIATSGTKVCEDNCSTLTPLAIWLIIIILLILLMIIVSLIFVTLRNAGLLGSCRSKGKPPNKSTGNITKGSSANDSKSTSSTPIPNLAPNTLPPSKSQNNASMKPENDLDVKSYENIPHYSKPSNVSHSDIVIQKCPAYRSLVIGEDYDDICSTAVIMQPNPSYKQDDMFSHNA